MRTTRGITLLETLVWIGLFIIAMGAVSQSLLYSYRVSNYAIQQATAITATQHGMDAIVRAIREVAYASNGAYPVVSMATSSFTFYVNADTDTAIERAHYYISETNLYLGLLQPAGDPATYTGTEVVSLISDNIKNTSQSVNLFTYYDTNGAQITDLTKIADVRFITVNLVADIDPNRAPTLISLRSSAAMRNLIN